MPTPRILAIEPIAASGHRNLNTFFLKALGELGSVTLATFSDYQRHFDVEHRLSIPDRPNCSRSAIMARISQMRALSYILRHAGMNQYDLCFFLCYEEISLALAWPKKYRTFLFEHNNVDKIRASRVKNFFFTRLGSGTIHLAYMDYIADYIRHTHGKQSYKISHPYYGKNLTASPDGAYGEPTKESRRKIIFSPSRSNDCEGVNALIEFVSSHDDYHLIAKADSNQTGPGYELSTFFEDYDEQMRNCDLVFFGGRYEYRVSGVVFEALSFGKPAVLLDCLFARELQKKHPHLVYPVKDISEIESLELNHDAILEEQGRFLHQHSFAQIRDELSQVVSGEMN